MTRLTFQIDYSLAMAEGLQSENAPTETAISSQSRAVETAIQTVLGHVQSGRLGFWDLPSDEKLAAELEEFCQGVSATITDVLVLGIGGSSLGAKAICHALATPIELCGITGAARRTHFPDNSDPWVLSQLLRCLKPEATLAIVISKSGSTVETSCQYLIVRQWLEQSLGNAKALQQLVMITDPQAGPLRAIAKEHQVRAFEIPSNVGGRFSVLSAVGLLPAGLAGVSIRDLLAGARTIAHQCERTQLRENPAALLACLHVLHHQLFHRSIHVLMPYSDALRPFAAWFVQLWAESLGKRVNLQGKVIEQGPTPVPAIGATDQHAQGQLFLEGPRDKLITFIGVRESEANVSIPASSGEFAYLGGHTLHELLEAERRGTAVALARDHRPTLTIEVGRVDAIHMGALLFLYQAATAFAGELYHVNAFDQPGVEEGKRLTYGLLGRKGFESAAKEVVEAEERGKGQFRWTAAGARN